ncbi:hypothetical protein [Senegalia massiliensis]|uniref:hypothetical protein n=1 Tax=Senegalia massiliensis TaxID=1720316 RepID=UPI0013638830|nr:hypothetical protein [Senegalia massiliensis]
MKKNYKRIGILGLAFSILIQAMPIATYAQSNNDELINIDYAYNEIQSLSPK